LAEYMPHPNDNRQGGAPRSKQIAVLHIPHSLRHVPAEERQSIVLDDAALNDELLRLNPATVAIAAVGQLPWYGQGSDISRLSH
jgi:hypothetical protein